MSDFKMTIPHLLTRKEVLRRTRALLEELKKEWAGSITNLEERWAAGTNRFSFEVSGFTISGVLVVEDTRLTLNGKIPFLLVPLQGRIESTIREKATSILAP